MVPKARLLGMDAIENVRIKDGSGEHNVSSIEDGLGTVDQSVYEDDHISSGSTIRSCSPV